MQASVKEYLPHGFVHPVIEVIGFFSRHLPLPQFQLVDIDFKRRPHVLVWNIHVSFVRPLRTLIESFLRNNTVIRIQNNLNVLLIRSRICVLILILNSG